MPSMSYCQFENTAVELTQVVNVMRDAESWEDLDLNEYENMAKGRLYNLCRNYIQFYDQLSDIEEFEDE